MLQVQSSATDAPTIADELGTDASETGHVAHSHETPASETATVESKDLKAALPDVPNQVPFDLLFEHSPIGMSITDPDGTFVRVNPALCAMLGRTADELLATTVDEVTHPDDLTLSHRTARRTDASNSRSVAKRFLHADGSAVLVRSTESDLFDDSGTPFQMLAQVEDLEGSRNLTAPRAGSSDRDQLTGLLNRDGIRAALDTTFDGPQADTAAVLFIDLDHFKDVNYFHNQSVGDELLVEVGARIIEAIRDGDLCGRPGDDEYLVVCHDIESFVDAYRVAERIRRSIEAPFTLSVGTVRTSCSIGIASGWPGATPDDVLASADAGRHNAKYLGRNRVENGR